VDRRKRLAIHFPGEHYFVDFHFMCGHADGVVVDVAFFEVCVGAEEFNVFAGLFEAAAVFDYFFEGHADVAGGADGAFGPGRVDEFVAVAGVFAYLLDATSAAALESDGRRHAREFGFILEVFEGDFHGLVDEAFDFEEVLFGIDFGDSAVVSNEVVFVRSNLGLYELVGSGTAASSDTHFD
jgi:hypothetical protein